MIYSTAKREHVTYLIRQVTCSLLVSTLFHILAVCYDNDSINDQCSEDRRRVLMDLRGLQEVIDRVIKEVWILNISKDYKSFYLLKEDTLKNALYYHLWTRLQHFFEQNTVRIYTEYFL